MTLLSPAAAALVKLMGDTPRGPRREGALALWLLIRLAEDLLLTPPLPERALRRRVALLERRLSSLAVSPPLRRALVGALAELREARREHAAVALQQLVAPTREVLGTEAGEALARVARQIRA